jgi:transcriptional regulator with XRE-family HTH domain
MLPSNVTQRRIALGLSQVQLAYAAGYTQGYIAELETGKKNPSVLAVRRIAAVLKTTASELMREDENETLDNSNRPRKTPTKSPIKRTTRTKATADARG